jgi:hypothetical protein
MVSSSTALGGILPCLKLFLVFPHLCFNLSLAAHCIDHASGLHPVAVPKLSNNILNPPPSFSIALETCSPRLRAPPEHLMRRPPRWFGLPFPSRCFYHGSAQLTGGLRMLNSGGIKSSTCLPSLTSVRRDSKISCA